MKEPPYQEPPLDGSGSNVSAPITVHRDDTLIVTRRDKADYGTQGEDGYYDHFYSFATYELETDGITYRARRYADTWQEVSLFAPETKPWRTIPYDDPAFARVARYFFALEDVEKVDVFLHEYQPVDRSRLC